MALVGSSELALTFIAFLLLFFNWILPTSWKMLAEFTFNDVFDTPFAFRCSFCDHSCSELLWTAGSSGFVGTRLRVDETLTMCEAGGEWSSLAEVLQSSGFSREAEAIKIFTNELATSRISSCWLCLHTYDQGRLPPSVLFNLENIHFAKDAGFHEVRENDAEGPLGFPSSQWQVQI